MKKLLKTLACSAVAALVGVGALADGLNAGNTLTIGGKTTDWSLWSQSGDSPTDLGYVSDLTVSDAKVFWWSDSSTAGANMFFVLWDGGAQPVGAWQDVWLGNSTFVDGDYHHDYTVAGPDGGPKDLNATWGVPLEEGKTYYLDVKVKTYNNDQWYPNGDPNAYYHAKFTYCTTLQKFVYNLSGGDSCDVMELQLPIGSTYDGAKQAVWANHVFRGWWTADGQTRYQNGKSVVPDNNGQPIQLYAHWSDAQVVHFNAGEGATCEPATVTLSQGETYWHFPTPIRDGYKFLGWVTAGGDRVRNGDSPVSASADLYLYAQWGEWRVVTLDAKGGDCAKPSITRLVGDVYWGLPSAPTKQNCKFLGWYTAETGGTRVRNGDTLNADDPTTLYAQWKENAAPLAITGFSFASKATKAKRDASASYARIDSLDDLEDGLYVILTADDGSCAMPATVNSSSVFAPVVSVTPDADDVITTDNASIVWKLVDDGNGNFSLYNETVAKFAGYPSSDNKGQLQDNACPNTITLLSGDLFKLVATGTTRPLQYNYNNGNARFAYYKATSNQKNLRIYAKVTTPEPPSTDPSVTVAASADAVHVGATPPVTITATPANFIGDVGYIWWVNGHEDENQTGQTYTLSTSVAGTYEVTVWAYSGDPDDPDELAEPITPATVKIQAAHEIDVEPGANGDAYADVATAFEGDTVTLTVDPDDGYTIDTITAYTLDDAPVDVDLDALTFVMPDEDVIVDVTFKEIPETVPFAKITSIDDVTEGEYVITGAGADDEEYAMKADTSEGTWLARRATAVKIESIDNVATVTDADDSIIWTLALVDADKGVWTVYNSAVGYVGWSSGNSAKAKKTPTQTEWDNGEFTWTIVESSKTDGLFLLRNVGTTSRYLQYNAGSPRFACYGNQNQTHLALYKKVEAVPMQTFLYDVNDGGTDEATCTVLELSLPIGSTYDGAVQAVWANHVFRGWWTADGQTRYQNGKSVVPDNNGEPIQLYAHWSDAQVVTFHAGDGATCEPGSVTLSQGATYWNFPTPIRDGYEFLGWFTAEEGGSRVRNGDFPVTTDSSRELFAHWVALKVVTLNAMGGDCSKTSITRPVGDVYWGLPSAPTKQDCSFLGWYTAETGGTRVRNGDTVNADDPTTLYAQWREFRVVTLNATGGECSKTSITRPVGDVYWGLPSAPTKQNCRFLGWYTAETDGKRVKNGDTLNADDPTTLYAHWKENAAPLAITGFSFASKAAPAARSAAKTTVECTLWVETVATLDYEILWTEDLTGEWTVLKRWTAQSDGEPVTVEIPADAKTGFFSVVEIVD